MKRFLSLILSLTLLCGVMTIPAWADDAADEPAAAVEQEAAVIEAAAPAAEPVEEAKPAASEPAAEPAPVAEEKPAEAEKPAAEPAPAAEEKPAEEEKPAAEPVAEEKPAAAEQPVAEPAPAAEEKPAEEEKPAAEPVVEEQPAAEPAPVVEEQPAASEPEQEPAAEVPAEEPAEAPAAEEPAAEPEAEPEAPAEEPAAAEEPAEEPEAPAAEEPAAEEAPADAEPEPAAEENQNAFRTGLAQLSKGDVFSDKKCKTSAGTVETAVVVFVTDRVKGEGELTSKDILQIALNADGEIRTYYVKYARLTYLTDEEAAKYVSAKHENAVEYKGVKLETAKFAAPAKAEEKQTEAPAAEPVEEKAPVSFEETEDTTAVDVADGNTDPITITTQPVDQVVEAGKPVSFTVEAQNVTKYQWQYTTNLTTWNDCTTGAGFSDVTTKTLKYTQDTTKATYYYRCMLTNLKYNVANTNEVYTSSVHADLSQKITITTQPKDQEAQVGATVEFKVVASNVTDYQWQYSKNGSTWFDIDDTSTDFFNSTTATLSFKMKSEYATWSFRCVLSNPGSSKNTDVVKVKLKPMASPVIQSLTVSNGNRVKVKWTGSEGAVSYVVYYNTANSQNQAKDVEVMGTTTLMVTNLKYNTTYYFWVAAVNDEGDSVLSASQSVKTGAEAVVTAAADKTSASGGQTVTYSSTVTDTYTDLWYKWQKSSDGVNWTACDSTYTGYNTQTMSFSATDTLLSYQYRLKIAEKTAPFREWFSNAVTVTYITSGSVKQPTVTTIPTLLVNAGQIIDYNFSEKGDLTLKWHANEGNGVYKVIILLTNTAPTAAPATNVVETLFSKTGKTDTYTIKKADMAKATYAKVWIQAQDQQYELNKKTKSIWFGIKFTATEQVSVSVSTSPSVSVVEKTVTDYNWAKKGDLTIKWSASHGNGKFSMKAILTNQVPSFTSANTVVKTIKSTTNDTLTTLHVSTEDMKLAKYLKVVITAQDANYALNGKTASYQFALLLRPDPKVSDLTASNPKINLTYNGTEDFNVTKYGDLKISWSAKNGNGKYTVTAVLATVTPTFGGATGGVVKTIVKLAETTKTSVTISKSTLLKYMDEGTYIKFVITAQDVNYARNGKKIVKEFGIHLVK